MTLSFGIKPLVRIFQIAPIGMLNAQIPTWYVAAIVFLIWQFFSNDPKIVKAISKLIAALYLLPALVLALTAIALIMMYSR